MVIKKKPVPSKFSIDLTGPDGNAFNLLAKAERWSRELNYSKEQTDKILEEMKSGDYDNLVETFDKYFGDMVILYR